MPDLIELWKGEFGNSYADRNPPSDKEIAKRILLWRKVLALMSFEDAPRSFLDVGAGLGANVSAIKHIYSHNKTDHGITAVELNGRTADRLLGLHSDISVVHGKAQDLHWASDAYADMVYTYGVLIHLDEEQLAAAMREIHRTSKRWIFCAEYFNPDTVSIPYRGQQNALFKRDYGSLWLDKFDLQPMAYGFEWKRVTGLDDVTWWLFRKVS